MVRFVFRVALVLCAVLTQIGSTPALEPRRLFYPDATVAALHLRPILLKPVVPLNFMRHQAYAQLGRGERDGRAGWEKFSTSDGTVRACIVPTEDGVERVTIVTLNPRRKYSWRDLLASGEALGATALLRRNEDGKKTLHIRINNLDSKYGMQITVIAGAEWIEQITWTLIG